MGIKLINGKYQVTFRDSQRREHQKTFRLKSEAEAWHAEKKGEIRKGNFIAESKETVAERAEGWLKRKHESGGYRFGTLQNYAIHIERYIKPELGEKRLQRVTILDCEEAALVWKERTSAYTANMVLKTLTAIFAEAQRHRLIELNPAEKAQRLKITTEEGENGEVQPEDVYGEDELGRLLGATEPGTPERLLIELGGFCGLRIGEILGFSWAAVDLKAAAARIRIIKNLVAEKKALADFPGYGDTGRTLKDPKKKSRRTLIAPRELIHDLKLWRLKCPPARPREWDGMDPVSKHLVMVTVEGKPLQKKAAQALLDQASDRAGIKRRTLHRLRHTFASHLLNAGEPLQKVSAMLGHRDIAITAKVYAHFIEQESSAIQDLASRILAQGQKKEK